MCDMKRLFNLQKEGGGCVTSSLYFVRGGGGVNFFHIPDWL